MKLIACEALCFVYIMWREKIPFKIKLTLTVEASLDAWAARRAFHVFHLRVSRREFSSSQDVNGSRSESQKLLLSFLFYLLDFVVAARLQLDASSCIEVDQLSSFFMSFNQSVTWPSAQSNATWEQLLVK